VTESQGFEPFGNRVIGMMEPRSGVGVHAMRKSKFTNEQIALALKQAELGTSVEEVCRKMAISKATYNV